ncbi:hypothetical protein [Rappaport israeli]|uniref:hypothetical protein n=1 Tax=Rappaport israeli TaxID=1839807 RepID=UPI000A4091A7|nr:hypothetical protein [Rappaport israeli]
MAQSLMEQEILQSAAVLAAQADNTAISDMAAKLAAELTVAHPPNLDYFASSVGLQDKD